MVDPRDEFFMRKALRLAERGGGSTSPNPMVGALVVDPEGVVVGRGAHEYAGGPHAEVYALRAAGARARGATLYCTLEPCAHQGRTGPCAPLVVNAGISRVVIATEDPNPRVTGRGCALMRDAGIDVTAGLLSAEAVRMNAPFFTAMQKRRPWVTMKIATSLDGAIASAPGHRTHLTGAVVRRYVHRERAEVDAIAVGSETVLVDDPVLTPRVAYRGRPLTRIIFDRRLRTPPTAAIFDTLDAGPVLIVTTAQALSAQAEAASCLAAAGAVFVAIGADESLAGALGRLLEMGVMSVIVEGGTTLHRAFWDAGLVDRVQMFVAPSPAGPGALRWLEAPVITDSSVVERRAVPLGEDVLIEAYVHRTD